MFVTYEKNPLTTRTAADYVTTWRRQLFVLLLETEQYIRQCVCERVIDIPLFKQPDFVADLSRGISSLLCQFVCFFRRVERILRRLLCQRSFRIQSAQCTRFLCL